MGQTASLSTLSFNNNEISFFVIARKIFFFCLSRGWKFLSNVCSFFVPVPFGVAFIHELNVPLQNYSKVQVYFVVICLILQLKQMSTTNLTRFGYGKKDILWCLILSVL